VVRLQQRLGRDPTEALSKGISRYMSQTELRTEACESRIREECAERFGALLELEQARRNLTARARAHPPGTSVARLRRRCGSIHLLGDPLHLAPREHGTQVQVARLLDEVAHLGRIVIEVEVRVEREQLPALASLERDASGLEHGAPVQRCPQQRVPRDERVRLTAYDARASSEEKSERRLLFLDQLAERDLVELDYERGHFTAAIDPQTLRCGRHGPRAAGHVERERGKLEAARALGDERCVGDERLGELLAEETLRFDRPDVADQAGAVIERAHTTGSLIHQSERRSSV